MDELMAVSGGSCSNGICAIGCVVGCLLTGGAPVVWGGLGGIIGAWAAS